MNFAFLIWCNSGNRDPFNLTPRVPSTPNVRNCFNCLELRVLTTTQWLNLRENDWMSGPFLSFSTAFSLYLSSHMYIKFINIFTLKYHTWSVSYHKISHTEKSFFIVVIDGDSAAYLSNWSRRNSWQQHALQFTCGYFTSWKFKKPCVVFAHISASQRVVFSLKGFW